MLSESSEIFLKGMKARLSLSNEKEKEKNMSKVCNRMITVTMSTGEQDVLRYWDMRTGRGILQKMTCAR